MVEAIRETQSNIFDKGKELREKVYAIKATLEPEPEDTARKPIYFARRYWSNGAFVILNLQPDILGKPSAILNGGEAWNVTARTKRLLKELRVPFKEGFRSDSGNGHR